MTPFWPAAAAPSVFGAKPYNLNVMPSADLHGANARGVVDNKGQPFTFFPGQSAASSKDTSQPSTSAPDSSTKKQILMHSALPVSPNTILVSLFLQLLYLILFPSVFCGRDTMFLCD